MKNQYFGDKHDFFKFDLLLTLIERLPSARRKFTYIPMLTPPDDTGCGEITDYAGRMRKDVWDFLKECTRRSNRNIVNIRFFMKEQGVQYVPYRDTEYFQEEERQSYFDEIDEAMLQGSVILVDPDAGFEPKKLTGKHLKYSEFAALYEKMDSLSLLLSIQSWRREKRKKTINEVEERIRRELKTEEVLCVHDNHMAFFIVAKTSQTLDEARETLKKQHSEYFLE